MLKCATSTPRRIDRGQCKGAMVCCRFVLMVLSCSWCVPVSTVLGRLQMSVNLLLPRRLKFSSSQRLQVRKQEGKKSRQRDKKKASEDQDQLAYMISFLAFYKFPSRWCELEGWGRRRKKTFNVRNLNMHTKQLVLSSWS
mmetsp:Transcript_61054/g.149478  ORF Transcript_61054/g.149478 Transcript_61054/m.149478 type:complete len:140 (-) Transcript_61054:446-865(-)